MSASESAGTSPPSVVAAAEASLAASLAALDVRWQRAQQWLKPARVLERPWVRFGVAVGAGFVLGSLRGRKLGPLAGPLLTAVAQAALRSWAR